jgi:hypothetical protein
MFHSFFRSLTFPAPFSTFSTQDDRLPALFEVGPGADLEIFLLLSRSLRLHGPKESKLHPGPPNSGLAPKKFGFRRFYCQRLTTSVNC